MIHARVLARSLPAFLLLSACATAPKPAPAPAAPKNETPRISLICHSNAVAARFEELGVPKGESPVDIAISGDATYVLFRPARLLRITRKEGKMQAEMALGRPDETWNSLAVDPIDGSVWIASNELALRRISPDWKARVVQLKKVEGEGGFQRIQVAKDAIYVMPTSAEESVWRVDREGNVLGTAFRITVPEAPAPDAPRQMVDLQDFSVRLEQDPEGNILVWDNGQEKLFQADGQGGWTEVDDALFAGIGRPQMESAVVKGLNVGSKDEQWLVATGARDLFYWKGRPAFLGPYTSRTTGGNETVILIPGSGGAKEIIENCYGQPIWSIATTSTSYAAVTTGGLAPGVVILGEFASAPDLP